MDPQSLTRRQLYDLVWKEPVQILADRFGLSDRGLAKLCERNSIPNPPRSYWARKQAGQKLVRPPLIEIERPNGEPDFPVLRPRPSPQTAESEGEQAPDPLLAFWTTQRDEIGKIAVAKTLTNPHAIIAGWIAEDERQRAVQSRWGGALSDFYKTTPLNRRRLRLLSALYKALEARGVTIACERNTRFASFRHERDQASFDLKEYVQQKRIALTDEERARGYGSRYRVDQIATGFLRGKVEGYFPKVVPSMWTESAESPFEDLLGEVAATILAALAQAKSRRLHYEEQERLRWEQRRAEEKREEEEKAERARERALRNRVKSWRRAQDLRAYVEAVRRAVAEGRLAAEPEALATWSTWALGHAAELDPLVAGDALETSEQS